MTGMLFGVAPAFRITRIEPSAALKSGGFAAGPGRRFTLGGTLVVVQVALSLLLVTGALVGLEVGRRSRSMTSTIAPMMTTDCFCE